MGIRTADSKGADCTKSVFPFFICPFSIFSINEKRTVLPLNIVIYLFTIDACRNGLLLQRHHKAYQAYDP